MKKNILFISLLLITSSCKDNMFSKTKEVIQTPGISVPPTTSPHEFSGAKAVTNITATTATITWEETADAATYSIFLATATTSPKVKEIIKAPQSSAKLTGLTPNTEYKVFIRMMDQASLIDDQFKAIHFKTLQETLYSNTTSVQFRGNESIELKESFKMFSHPNKFAISFWFKSNSSLTDDPRLVSFHRSYGPSENLAIGVDNGKLFLTYINSSGELKKNVTTESVFNGQWHHVLLNVQPETMELYLDNILVLTRKDLLSAFGNHKARLASLSGYQKGFEGQMDEVSFWNRPLTDLERTNIFTNVKTLNLKAYDGLSMWLRMGDDPQDLASALIDQVTGEKMIPFGIEPSDFLNLTP